MCSYNKSAVQNTEIKQPTQNLGSKVDPQNAPLYTHETANMLFPSWTS